MGKQCCHFFSASVDQILFIFVSRFCLFCAFTRPRYQVSIYTTMGPLVSESIDKSGKLFHELCVQVSVRISLKYFIIIKKLVKKYIKLYSYFWF